MTLYPNKQEYKESEVGSIPIDWDLSEVGNVFNVKQGKQLSSKEKIEGKTLRTSNVFWWIIDLSNIDYMYFTPEELNKLELKQGDILLCEGGDVGRTAVWNFKLDGYLYQNHLHRLRNKNNNINNYFFAYWMQYAILIKGFYIKQANRTTIPNLSSSRLKSFQIPLPPIDEQKAIAHILSSIQEAKEKTEAIIQATKELKKSMMKHLFTYGPVPVDEVDKVKLKETEIGLMPEDWDIAPLEEVTDVIYGIQASVAGDTDPSIGIPILTNINITLEGTIDLTDLKYFNIDTKTNPEKYLLQKGDVLFNWRSGSKNHVGKTAFFNYDIRMTFASFILRIRIKDAYKVNNKYIYYYLKFMKDITKYFIKFSEYMINAKFNASYAKKIPTVLPPIEIQNKIAHTLSSIDDKIESESFKLNSINLLFNSILDYLMTGKIRVRNILSSPSK